MTADGDGELVTRALGDPPGSDEAFGALVERYQRPVFTLVLRMVRDRTLAEDLAQEAFLKAYEKLATYDPERKFSSWLFKIAHNTAIDHLRRRRLATVSIDQPIGDADDGPARILPDDDGPDPFDSATQSDLSRALAAAVGALRPEYRRTVLLRYQAGLEYAEIAEAEGLPLGTVKTYLHRARKELAGLLEQAGWRP